MSVFVSLCCFSGMPDYYSFLFDNVALRNITTLRRNIIWQQSVAFLLYGNLFNGICPILSLPASLSLDYYCDSGDVLLPGQ